MTGWSNETESAAPAWSIVNSAAYVGPTVPVILPGRLCGPAGNSVMRTDSGPASGFVVPSGMCAVAPSWAGKSSVLGSAPLAGALPVAAWKGALDAGSIVDTFGLSGVIATVSAVM